MRFSTLLNSTGYARVMMAPPDMPGGGDGNDTEVDVNENYFDDGFDDSDDTDSSEFQDNNEINVASDPDLKDFWNVQDGNDSPSETPEQRNARLRQEEKDIAAELQSSLDSFALADDLIPDEFNPTDPQQMREVLASAIRQGAAMTMQLMFKPVNKALQTHNQNLRDYVQQHVSSNTANGKFESMLFSAIPAAKDPLAGPMIRQLAETQRKRYPDDPVAAIRAVRKGMKAMGMSIQPNGRPNNLPPGSQSGPGMLDGFFTGLQARQTPANNTRQRLKK